MKAPDNYIQEILFTAMKNGSVSLIDFPHLASFRTRISELRLNHNIIFKDVMVKRENKYGRRCDIVNHILVDVEKANSIYNKMTRL